MLNKKDIIKKLELHKISFDIHEHDALFSVSDSEQKRGGIVGGHTKNLFLKNKKNNFYLISCQENLKVDIKKFSKINNIGNLSFANEKYLYEYLGVLPGSVSPFGLLNDINNKVSFIIDGGLLNFKKINFHPLVNTATITLKMSDFLEFMKNNKKKISIFDFNNYIITNE